MTRHTWKDLRNQPFKTPHFKSGGTEAPQKTGTDSLEDGALASQEDGW